MRSAILIGPSLQMNPLCFEDEIRTTRLRSYNKTVLSQISSSLEFGLPIPPLQSIIGEYAEFVGWVTLGAGSAQPGDKNGIGSEARFDRLGSITRCSDLKELTFLLADGMNKQIRHFNPSTGEVKPYASYAADRNDPYHRPKAIRPNPLQDDEYFVLDYVSVRRLYDRTIMVGTQREVRRTLTEFAGSTTQMGNREGFFGTAARFNDCQGLCIHPNGLRLFITEYHGCRVREVNTITTEVRTVAGSGDYFHRDGKGSAAGIYFPLKCVFFRQTSILFITALDAIRRFDTDSYEMTTLHLKSNHKFNPAGIACTASGTLIFGCQRTHALWAADPTTREVERVAGTGMQGDSEGDAMKTATFHMIFDLYIDEKTQSAWTVEPSRVRCVTLPPYLF